MGRRCVRVERGLQDGGAGHVRQQFSFPESTTRVANTRKVRYLMRRDTRRG